MKSYSRLSFLHQWAEGNYSVDHSLFAFLLPPTEARATATVAETVPRLPYLHICIIKTFVKIWRNIVSDVTRGTLQHLKTKTLWLKKSHGTQHLCPLSQHLSLLLWKQLLFSRRGNETGSTPSLEAVYSSRCIDLYRSIILLVSNALIIITFDCPTPIEFSDALMQNDDWINVNFIVVKWSG